MTELTVADNGPGVPNYVHQAIRQRTENQLVHLDGIGLWFVYWTVTTGHGEFTIEDREPRGTRITLHLPTAVSQFTNRSAPLAPGTAENSD